MRKKIGRILSVGLLVFAVLGACSACSFVNLSAPAMAENEFTEKGCDIGDEATKAALGCDQTTTAPSVIEYLIKAVISVLGIVAVFVIVMGGQRYIVSNGDPGKVTQAKNMILYGIIGLVVALLAFAIVSFVVSAVFSSK